MIGAALPEPPAVAWDVADPLVLVREVHLPDEGAVAKHPHSARLAALRGGLPGRGSRRGEAAAAGGPLHAALGGSARLRKARWGL